MSAIVLLLLLFSGVLFGQNYPSFPIGERWLFPDARSLALGGAGSVSLDAPGAMLYNPAALTQVRHPLEADFSMNIRKFEERRSFPLYDRFNGVVGQGIYVDNNNWFPAPEGAISARLPLADITLAAGSFIDTDQNYIYDEEVRENVFGDSLLAYNHIRFDGMLRRYGLAAALPLPMVEGLSLGVQASLLQGDLNFKREINYIRTTSRDSLDEVNRSLDNTPLVVSLGAIYRMNERFTGGVDVSLPYTVKYKAAVGNEEIKYPLKLNAGVEFRARQVLQARLNIDFGYEFWSSASYSSTIPAIARVVSPTLEFSDVYKIRVGIEQIFFNRVPFRVGMQYRNSYQQRGRTQTLLTAGTGFLGKNWKVDLSGGVGKITYSWPDLFNDNLYGGLDTHTRMDQVQELTYLLKATLSYNLDF